MPIIGHGDIASVLIDREDVTFFASGVSNSSCTDVNEYEREVRLLFDQPKDKHLVYFSTLSRYYNNNQYVFHKWVMEQNIQRHWHSYTIIRLGNIDWGKNPNTLINYLKAHPEAEIQNTYRHIVSLAEFKYWVNLIKVPSKDIMNVPGRMIYVPDLAAAIKERVGDDVLLAKASGERCRNGYNRFGFLSKTMSPVDDALHWPDPPNNIDL